MLWDITGVFYDRSSCKMIDSQLEQELRDIAETARN